MCYKWPEREFERKIKNPGVITDPRTRRGRPGEYNQYDSKSPVVMQEDYVRHLCELISEPRIHPYRRDYANSDWRACGAYAWNIALCESLYPALNGLEVALRNSIQHATAHEFDDEYWFDSLSLKKSRDAVSKARNELAKDRSSELISAGDLVARLNFGFWVGSFDSKYEQKLWPRLLGPDFPNLPRKHRTRSTLAGRLHLIRHLRNRVFHHEPVWNRTNLNEQHGQVVETIGWIDHEMRQFVEMLDRFPETYARGAEFYEQELLSVFQN